MKSKRNITEFEVPLTKSDIKKIEPFTVDDDFALGFQHRDKKCFVLLKIKDHIYEMEAEMAESIFMVLGYNFMIHGASKEYILEMISDVESLFKKPEGEFVQ